MNNIINIGMIGLGKLGKPVLEYFKETLGSNVECYGYDVLPNITSSEFETTSTIKELCRKSTDIIFIAVPTPHDPEYDGSKPTSKLPCKDFDTSMVEDVLNGICEYRTSGQVVVLISTVLPGTTRDRLAYHVPDLIYNPYFIAMGTVKYDMENPEMIVIGDSKVTNGLDKLLNFYNLLYKDKDIRFVSGTWEEAECIKVFYNTFITAKLTFVNMIQDFAQKIGFIDPGFVSSELAKSTNRLMSDKYMNPGLGDGGPCHPRDNIALSFLSEKYGMNYDLFGDLMSIREKQAMNTAEFLVNTLKNNGCDQIVINGKTYKEGVPLIDGSSAMLVGHYCEQLGHSVVYVDPTINECPSLNTTLKYVVLLSHTKLYFTPSKNSVVVDIWNNYKCRVVK